MEINLAAMIATVNLMTKSQTNSSPLEVLHISNQSDRWIQYGKK